MCRCAFNGIFNVEYWRNLEMYVRGHSRSLEMAPFDRSHTISYLSFIVNVSVFCTVLLHGNKHTRATKKNYSRAR